MKVILSPEAIERLQAQIAYLMVWKPRLPRIA